MENAEVLVLTDWRRLGQITHERRLAAGMTQGALAGASGVGRATIANLETGVTGKGLSFPMVMALLRALGIRITD